MEGAAFYGVAAVGIWFVPTPADIAWVTPTIALFAALGCIACLKREA